MHLYSYTQPDLPIALNVGRTESLLAGFMVWRLAALFAVKVCLAGEPMLPKSRLFGWSHVCVLAGFSF